MSPRIGYASLIEVVGVVQARLVHAHEPIDSRALQFLACHLCHESHFHDISGTARRLAGYDLGSGKG